MIFLCTKMAAGLFFSLFERFKNKMQDTLFLASPAHRKSLNSGVFKN